MQDLDTGQCSGREGPFRPPAIAGVEFGACTIRLFNDPGKLYNDAVMKSAMLPPEMNSTDVDSYSLRLKPDFVEFRFSGTVAVSLTAQRNLDRLLFHARDLTIRDAVIKAPGIEGQTTWEHYDDDILSLECGTSLEGSIRVEIEFDGELNDQLVGFYRSELRGSGGEDEKDENDENETADQTHGYCAVTQFEENEARRAFPCIDHPSKKAVFEVELLAPEGAVAVANTPCTSTQEIDDGYTLYTFDKTPEMPTYLLFFGIGRFEIAQDDSWRIPIRIVSGRGKSRYANRALTYTREALSFCEEYIGIEYPIGKMDLIGVPDFAYGAMENFGAITFRENYLYEYPGITSEQDLERTALIIAHEVAHMWFGNLVSPLDWSYIWLNESFATYFGHVIVEAHHPEWENLKQFIAGSYDGAMSRDALHETIPIEFPEGGFTDVDPSTAPIIYSKAGAILHMVRDYLGEDRFRKGVHEFLSEFQFDSADTEDFLAGFGRGAEGSTSEILMSWIRQPGFPQVEPSLNVSAYKATLELRQHRFTYLPNDTTTVWPIPVSIRVISESGEVETQRVLMNEPAQSIDLPGGTKTVKLNAGQAGFYRTIYRESILPGLGEAYEAAVLDELDRYGLLADLRASADALVLDLDSFIDFLSSYLENEHAELPISVFCNVCNDALRFLPSRAEKLAGAAQSILRPVIHEIGLEPAENEKSSTRRMRTAVLGTAFLAHDQSVIDYLSARFDDLKAERSIPTDLRGLVITSGASLDSESYDWFIERIEDTDTPEVTVHQLLRGLGMFKREQTLTDALEYVASNVPVRNRIQTVATATRNPTAIEVLRKWTKSHLRELSSIHPYHFAAILAAVIPSAWVGREAEALELFREDAYPRARGTIRMSLERLRIRTKYLSRYR